MCGQKPCRWKPAHGCLGSCSQTQKTFETQRKRRKGSRVLISLENDSNLFRFLCVLFTSVFQGFGFIWAALRVSPRPKISRGFPAAEQIDVAPELPRAAVQTDARPAAVAAQLADVPEQVVEAACIDVPAAVAEAACMSAAVDCNAAPAAEPPAYLHYPN